MMVTWKYTLPAFIVPFMFTLDREGGTALLAMGPTMDVVLATLTACLAIVALVGGVGGWIIRQATWLERGILIVAAGLLFYTGPCRHHRPGAVRSCGHASLAPRAKERCRPTASNGNNDRLSTGLALIGPYPVGPGQMECANTGWLVGLNRFGLIPWAFRSFVALGVMRGLFGSNGGISLVAATRTVGAPGNAGLVEKVDLFRIHGVLGLTLFQHTQHLPCGRPISRGRPMSVCPYRTHRRGQISPPWCRES
jgi:hypothetical protein